MCVYIVKLPPDTLPQWRQFGLRQCDLRPSFLWAYCDPIKKQYFRSPSIICTLVLALPRMMAKEMKRLYSLYNALLYCTVYSVLCLV